MTHSIRRWRKAYAACWPRRRSAERAPFTTCSASSTPRELRDMKVYELDYIAGLAGSKHSMGTEISKGRNLAQFVEVKPEYRSWP